MIINKELAKAYAYKIALARVGYRNIPISQLIKALNDDESSKKIEKIIEENYPNGQGYAFINWLTQKILKGELKMRKLNPEKATLVEIEIIKFQLQNIIDKARKFKKLYKDEKELASALIKRLISKALSVYREVYGDEGCKGLKKIVIGDSERDLATQIYRAKPDLKHTILFVGVIDYIADIYIYNPTMKTVSLFDMSEINVNVENNEEIYSEGKDTADKTPFIKRSINEILDDKLSNIKPIEKMMWDTDEFISEQLLSRYIGDKKMVELAYNLHSMIPIRGQENIGILTLQRIREPSKTDYIVQFNDMFFLALNEVDSQRLAEILRQKAEILKTKAEKIKGD